MYQAINARMPCASQNVMCITYSGGGGGGGGGKEIMGASTPAFFHETLH